jgi:glutaconate CoA-transferase subunit A
VVVEPWGAHPSYVQGSYDRDNRFYRDWVHGVDGRAAYLEKLGAERLASLRPSGTAFSGVVDYGEYR